MRIKKQNNQGAWVPQTLSTKRKLIPLMYRVATLMIAILCTILIIPAGYFKVSPYILFAIAIMDTTLIALIPFLVPRRKYAFLSTSRAPIDTMICIALVVFSGSINSPFILYSLAPVLTAALILNKKITFGVSVATGVGVIISHIVNPFYVFQISLLSLSQLTIYAGAICLTTFLPYLVNIDLKRHLQDEQVFLERQRLSHEIHDGVAQTLHALCWQVQVVSHRLSLTNSENRDIEKLEKLAEKARQDILQALDILRKSTSESNLQTLLAHFLEEFKQDTDIDYSLNAANDDFDLDSPVKKELMSIFQEALANIKKHSGAHNIQVNLKRANSHLELDIIDNGRGFDAGSHYASGIEAKGHHGLAVMRERARLINGQFRVSSLPDQGTKVKIEVPLDSRRG